MSAPENFTTMIGIAMNIRHLLFILVASLLAGCGAQAAPTSQIPLTEELEPTEEVADSEAVSNDGLPGAALFKTFYEDAQFSCATCHYPHSNDRLLGPGLLGIEDRFETYDVEAETVEAYIHQSILDPHAFIVPDESPYPENLMPTVYGDIFSEKELDDLVAYILSF